MRIAVAYDNGEIFQYFGHTEHFMFYDTEDNKIISSKLADTNGSGHGALANFLQDNKVDALICGDIGGGAQSALASVGIMLYGGVSGSADDAVKALISGNLEFNPNIKCSHHDNGGNHSCAELSYFGEACNKR